MALSGNLGFVPLDEVLRLLARAGQKGSVKVSGNNVDGRIFVTKQGVALATTFDDSSLRAHLINSELVEPEFLAGVEQGTASLQSVAEKDPDFTALLREMTVESVFQMTRSGSSFEVQEDATTPYASPNAFELEGILEDARRRADEWSEVEGLIADMAGVIKMKRDLGDRDEVTLNKDAWKLLSELGAGSSVAELAERLGTTEFWAAKVASDLSSRQLLLIDSSGATHTEPVERYEAPPVEAAPVEAASAEPPPDEPFTAEESMAPLSADDEDVDPDESWWVEPEGKESEQDEPFEYASEDEAELDEEQPLSARGGRLGIFAPSRNGSTDDSADEGAEALPPIEAEEGFQDVEDDTEAFLEKVFSELEPEDEPESEGHGLLRRRRLGTMIPDASNDD